MKLTLLKKYTVLILVFFLLIMATLAFFIIRTVREQLTLQYEERVAAASLSVQQELIARSDKVSRQLQALAKYIEEDRDFRFRTVQQREIHSREVIDYAGNFMNIMGLNLLDITDANGLLLSSGSNRNAFGNRYRQLVTALRERRGRLALTWMPGIAGRTLCLTRIDSLNYGPIRFYLLGGVEVTPAFLRELRGDTTEIVAIQLNDSLFLPSQKMDLRALQNLPPPGDSTAIPVISAEQSYAIQTFRVPLLSNEGTAPSRFVLFHPRTTFLSVVKALKSDIIGVMTVGLLLAVGIAVLLALTVTRPLKELTDKASALSLENLDVEFDVHRRDEFGILNDTLNKMLRRLRQNKLELALAEQKASFVDIARQVNHDIKNGFIPIRNVMNHWEEVYRDNPQDLPRIFEERKENVKESLAYLENLARRYSRLQLAPNLAPIDLNSTILNLIKNYENISERPVQFVTALDESQPCIRADAVQLRRAFENVLRNAIEAMPNGGTITISTRVEQQHVIITWADQGTGIPENIRKQLFTVTVTTKPEGTGLGLANVKRIIDSFNGSVSVEPGESGGTVVRIELPMG